MATPAWASPVPADEPLRPEIMRGPITGFIGPDDGDLRLNLTMESMDAFSQFTIGMNNTRAEVLLDGEVLISPVIASQMRMTDIPINLPMSDERRREITADLVSGKSRPGIRAAAD